MPSWPVDTANCDEFACAGSRPSASSREVVIKTQKGLLSISDLGTWWRRATELTAARVLNIRASHITAVAALPMLHKDPFDRILVAQAKAEGLALVTNDASIGGYPIRTL